MSTIFSLAIVNPNVSSSQKNVIYTGLATGNQVNLVIGNNYGYNLTIGGSSTGKWLILQIPDSIISDDAAKKMDVASPWKMDSFLPPAKAGGNYSFNLLPPPKGVELPNGGNIAIQLTGFLPIAKGNLLLVTSYEFDTRGTNMNVSAPLVVLGVPAPHKGGLFGGSKAALRFSFAVNKENDSTPILVSEEPVTPENAFENFMQMIFTFQQTGSNDSTSGPWLVDSWDAASPPQLRFFFPYFNPTDSSPATIDLTDDYKPHDPSYNSLTSAWNIMASLDNVNPSITRNVYWEISLDSTPGYPVWVAQPTPANTHVFTSEKEKPGPLLSLFFSKIYSGLPVDSNNPETLLHVQWNDFPKFNDGIESFPVLKAPLLPIVIQPFTGEVLFDGTGQVSIQLNWEVTNADHCFISGKDEPQPLSVKGDAGRQRVDKEHPLLTTYTLKAVDKYGRTASKSLVIKWRVNSGISPARFPDATRLRIFHDNSAIVILQSPSDPNEENAQSNLLSIDPTGLNQVNEPFVYPESLEVYWIEVSATDNNTVFGIGFPAIVCGPDTPMDMFAFSYNKSNRQIVKSEKLAFPPYANRMNISSDGSVVACWVCGAPGKVNLLDSGNLRNITGSPIDGGTINTLSIGPQTRRLFIAYNRGPLKILDPISLQDVPGSPFAADNLTSLIFPSDESVIFAIGLHLEIRDPVTFAIQKKVDFNLCAFMNGTWFPNFVTRDNAQIFIAGWRWNQSSQRETLIQVFDAHSLEILVWSLWDNPAVEISDMQLSPDGSLIYVLSAEGDLYLYEPYF